MSKLPEGLPIGYLNFARRLTITKKVYILANRLWWTKMYNFARRLSPIIVWIFPKGNDGQNFLSPLFHFSLLFFFICIVFELENKNDWKHRYWWLCLKWFLREPLAIFWLLLFVYFLWLFRSKQGPFKTYVDRILDKLHSPIHKVESNSSGVCIYYIIYNNWKARPRPVSATIRLTV